MQQENQDSQVFTSYQKFVIFILAVTQFTVVLDFTVMSPLGDLMMKTLSITTSQFGMAVSAYAFSAGISGFLTAGFADRYDRKKLLLFFYIGFIIGTFFCAIAPNYHLLVAARIFTGIFGGVISSISLAIIADLFKLEQRGKVMGFVQMGFGLSQIIGIPFGLYVANHWGWQIPFYWIAIMAGFIAIALYLKLKPIAEHLKIQKANSAFQHLLNTLAPSKYRLGFLTTSLLSVGGFMIMPFGSAFAINNLKITNEQLPTLFMVSGITSFIMMPLVGKYSDKRNKFVIFTLATLMAIVVLNIYSNFSTTPFIIVLITYVVMMFFIISRMIPGSALTTAIPKPEDRGAYMSITSSLQQMAGGVGAMIAGMIIVQKDNYAPLENFNLLTMIMSVIMLFTIYLMYRVNKNVMNNN